MYNFLPKNANTFSEVKQYYYIRSLEMDVVIDDIIEDENGVFVVTMFKDNETYYSVYIPERLRGKGLLKEYTHLRILTIKDCDITEALEHLGFKYKILSGWFDLFEYEALKHFVGDYESPKGKSIMEHTVEETARFLGEEGAPLNKQYINRQITNYLKSIAIYVKNSREMG